MKPQKTIYAAHGFVVNDSQGRERITLSCTDEGIPYITMRDTKGIVRVKLQLGVMGCPAEICQEPGLTFFDENGKICASAGVNDKGAPCVWVEDENGKVLWNSPVIEKLQAEYEARLAAAGYKPRKKRQAKK